MTEEWRTPRVSPFGDSDDVSRRSAFDRDSLLRRLDWPLLLAVVALLAIGCALVYSATVEESGQRFIVKHIINITVGAGLAIGATMISYETMRAYAPFVYGAGILGLMAVLVIGIEHSDAKSWIRVGAGFEIQPSEFAKVALVVMLATILGERREGEPLDDPAPRRVLAAVGLSVFPMGLIMLQPDFGTTMVFVFTMFAVLLTAPVKMRWIGALVVAGAMLALVAVQFNIIKPYQVDRLTVFTQNVDEIASGRGGASDRAQKEAFQIQQSEIAISSGGVRGVGLLKGERYVPVQESDFIFTVPGEEFGFLGSSAIVALLGVVVWRGLRIARRAKDRFGALVAIGVAAWFGIQSFENVGMTIGVMPITGIPLPFLSYGGSSMFAALLAVGFLQNIHLRTERKAT